MAAGLVGVVTQSAVPSGVYGSTAVLDPLELGLLVGIGAVTGGAVVVAIDAWP